MAENVRSVAAVFTLRVDKSGFQQAEASVEKLKGKLGAGKAGGAAGKSLNAGLETVEKRFGGLKKKMGLESGFAKLGKGFGDFKEKFGSIFDNLKGGFGDVGGSMGDLLGGLGKGGLGGALAGIGAGVAVVAGITAGLVALARASANVADEADRMATMSGVSTAEFQRLAYAGKFVGVSAEALKTALQQVANTYEDARKGGAEDIKTLKALGLTWRDLKGQSPAKMLETISDRLIKLPPTERIAVAKKIGKSWTDLLPLLKAGGKGLKEAGDEAEKFNLVMSEEQIKNSVEFNENWTRATGILEGFRNMLAKELLPIMEHTVKAFVDWYKTNKTIIDQRVETMIRGIAGAFKLLYAQAKPTLALLDTFVLSPLEMLTAFADDIANWVNGDGESLIGDAFTTFSEMIEQWTYEIGEVLGNLIPVNKWLDAIDEFVNQAIEKLGPLGIPLLNPTRTVRNIGGGIMSGPFGAAKKLAGAGYDLLPPSVKGLLGGGPEQVPIASGPNGEPIYASAPSIPTPSIPAGPQSSGGSSVNVGGVSNSFVINGATDAEKLANFVDDRIMASWRGVEASVP